MLCILVFSLSSATCDDLSSEISEMLKCHHKSATVLDVDNFVRGIKDKLLKNYRFLLYQKS